MEAKKGCESCGHWQVVSATFGFSLRELGMTDRFCSSCLHAELDALGLVRRWHTADEDHVSYYSEGEES